MQKLKDVKNVSKYLKGFDIEETYALAVAEGIQQGEIFVDQPDEPEIVLVWHYCGFAGIAGDYKDEHIREILEMMKNPPENHSKRLAFHIREDEKAEKILLSNPEVKKGERYIFQFKGLKDISVKLEDGYELQRIDAVNYDYLTGRIIPAFSWTSKEEFLKKGFGYGIVKDNKAFACAFSSGVSMEQIDIGVETIEGARGKGFAKIVASAMVEEVLKMGKTPVWSCDTRNEASAGLAQAVGFEIVGKHPWYVI